VTSGRKDNRLRARTKRNAKEEQGCRGYFEKEGDEYKRKRAGGKRSCSGE